MLLAPLRAAMRPAPHDLGLTQDLRVRSPDNPNIAARVAAGAPYPALDIGGRRVRGAFDTPAPPQENSLFMFRDLNVFQKCSRIVFSFLCAQMCKRVAQSVPKGAKALQMESFWEGFW